MIISEMSINDIHLIDNTMNFFHSVRVKIDTIQQKRELLSKMLSFCQIFIGQSNDLNGVID